MDAPAVAVSADGKKIVVAWMDTRRERQERDVFWRVVDPSSKGPEKTLGEKSDGIEGHPSIVLGSDGVVHAAWESDGVVYRCTSKDPKPVAVSELSEKDAEFASIATNGKTTVVAYECRVDGKKRAICRPVK